MNVILVAIALVVEALAMATTPAPAPAPTPVVVTTTTTTTTAVPDPVTADGCASLTLTRTDLEGVYEAPDTGPGYTVHHIVATPETVPAGFKYGIEGYFLIYSFDPDVNTFDNDHLLLSVDVSDPTMNRVEVCR